MLLRSVSSPWMTLMGKYGADKSCGWCYSCGRSPSSDLEVVDSVSSDYFFLAVSEELNPLLHLIKPWILPLHLVQDIWTFVLSIVSNLFEAVTFCLPLEVPEFEVWRTCGLTNSHLVQLWPPHFQVLASDFFQSTHRGHVPVDCELEWKLTS